MKLKVEEAARHSPSSPLVTSGGYLLAQQGEPGKQHAPPPQQPDLAFAVLEVLEDFVEEAVATFLAADLLATVRIADLVVFGELAHATEAMPRMTRSVNVLFIV